MNWWGKLIGSSIGMLGGPFGALAGAAIGHLYDEDDPATKDERKARVLYLAYFFSCAAKIAKADGQVSAKEIEATETIMNRMVLNKRTKEFAKNVFRKAKNSNRSIDEDFKEVARLISYDPVVSQTFLGGLFEIANSNSSKLSKTQIRFLLYGEKRLKLPSGLLQSWLSGGYAPPRYGTSSNDLSIADAYNTLGLNESCTDAELKAAYRNRAASFHPDKLKSKNLPEEFTSFANDQLAKINHANEVIQKARAI